MVTRGVPLGRLEIAFVRERMFFACTLCANLMMILVTSWVDKIMAAEVSFHGNLNRSGKGQGDLAAITPR